MGLPLQVRSVSSLQTLQNSWMNMHYKFANPRNTCMTLTFRGSGHFLTAFTISYFIDMPFSHIWFPKKSTSQWYIKDLLIVIHSLVCLITFIDPFHISKNDFMVQLPLDVASSPWSMWNTTPVRGPAISCEPPAPSPWPPLPAPGPPSTIIAIPWSTLHLVVARPTPF
jgi:hypothetical protein